MVVNILTEIKSSQVDQLFSYLVPAYLEQHIEVGKRVIVPFGNRKIEGIIFELSSYPINTKYKMKDIIDVIDTKPIISEELIKLAYFIKENYFCSLTMAVNTILPKALTANIKTNINIKKIEVVSLNTESNLEDYLLKNISDRQREIISLLKASDKKASYLRKLSISAFKTLIKNEIITLTESEIYRDTNIDYKQTKKEIILNRDQLLAVKSIKDTLGSNKISLLHGVTGSGKTEVYIEIIDEVIKSGKEAIVLVPEISLTPQTVARFKQYFSDNIAIMHSGLNQGEKFDEWRKIERQEVKIAIGARSNVFVPFTNLGIIIIDEEHEKTYKQDNNPSYHTLEIAELRSKHYKCPIILGSATPRLESMARAKKGIYQLVELPTRINKQFPKVELINMIDEMKQGARLFSKPLIKEIKLRLDNKEQIILLLNRRGYSNFTICKECGYTQKCKHCDVTLTYHKTSHSMICHYCGLIEAKLYECPVCQSKSLKDMGTGTEKVAEMLQKEFSDARILRMDADTTRKKNSHQKLLNSFGNHDYDILIGTQMIAKGLDFSNVTLVGVINADTSLSVPDFRSMEYTFQLLSQVSGRSGRGEKQGLVLIQTFNDDNYAIIKAAKNDYKGFYEKEMNYRKQLKYPPYYYMIDIKVTSKDLNLLKKDLGQIASFLRSNAGNQTVILGPSPDNNVMINNIYRYHIIIKYRIDDNLMSLLERVNKYYVNNKLITVNINKNPM